MYIKSGLIWKKYTRYLVVHAAGHKPQAMGNALQLSERCARTRYSIPLHAHLGTLT